MQWLEKNYLICILYKSSIYISHQQSCCVITEYFQSQNNHNSKNTISLETSLSSTSSWKVSHYLKVLGQLQDKREGDLAGILTGSIPDESDVESVSSTLIYGRFYTNRWSQMSMEMCNVDFSEFEHLWHCCSAILTQWLKIGLGTFLLSCVSWKLQGIGIWWAGFLKKWVHTTEAFSHVVEILSPFLCEEYIINYHKKLKNTIQELFLCTLCQGCNFSTGEALFLQKSWQNLSMVCTPKFLSRLKTVWSAIWLNRKQITITTKINILNPNWITNQK